MPKKEIKAPYDKTTGNLLSYVYDDEDSRVDFRKNVPFEATMKFTDMERGQSAARFIVTDEHGKTYPMFMSSALKLLQSSIIINGSVLADWIVVKRGSNYGIEKVS